MLAKVTERIKLRLINAINQWKKITPDIQYGFRQSTAMQVARIANDIAINFNKNKNTALTLIEIQNMENKKQKKTKNRIQKEFDKVWINGLIYKLKKLNFPEPLIRLTHSYLANRKFKVKIQNSLSDSKNFTAPRVTSWS